MSFLIKNLLKLSMDIDVGRTYRSSQDERRRRQREQEEGSSKEDEFIDYGGPHRHCYFCYSFTLCNMR